MAQYRTCVAAGILLLAVLASAQPSISATYGPQTGVQTFFTGPFAANTPAVVLGSWAYVGTAQGVVGGSIFSGASSNFINNPSINITTPYPVTGLWNTSATEMVAVTNDTLRAFNGNASLWNFTSAGFQFDFAAMMGGQYPTPLVWNNTIFVGTQNSNWVSGTGWSWVYAINAATGAKIWGVQIPAPYTNYQIGLGDDLQTLIVRATNPSERTTIYLLRGADGMMVPFMAQTNYNYASYWLPQSSLYNGTLWINDNCGYIFAVNVSTNASQQGTYSGCSSSGFAPVAINGTIYIVGGNYVISYSANPNPLTRTGSDYGNVGTLQQVVPYGPTKYIFCGSSGLNTYDTTTLSFSFSSGFFTPNTAASCQSLSWVNGLLVASWSAYYTYTGGSVNALNVTAGTIVWQNQGVGVSGVGWITVLPTAGGNTYVMANSGAFSTTAPSTSLVTWSAPSASGGWSAGSLSPTGITFFGAPYNVVVVQSSSSDTVTVIGAFNGTVLSTFGVSTYSSDPQPFLVGDFACCTGYSYLWCVALTSGKTSFKLSPVSSGTATVSGGTLYWTSNTWPLSIKSLDTTASSPALTAVTLPTPSGSLSSLAEFRGGIIAGQNAAGQAMLFGATDEYTLYGIAVGTAATSWAIYTLGSTLTNAQGYGAYFTTNVVQIPGDSNILIGGTRTPKPVIGSTTILPVQFGLMKFDATTHLFVDIYTYPSVTVTPLNLYAGNSLVLIGGTSNLTATNQNGNKFWNLALGSSNVITGVTLVESSGAVFVSTTGTGNFMFYTLSAYTGAILWSSTASATAAPTVVNGLVFWGSSQLRVANLVTGQLVATFPITYGQVGNATSANWVIGSINSGVFAAPLANSTMPPLSQRTITGTFSPAAPTTGETEAENKLWIIAVVVGFLLVVIVIAVVVSRKKSAPKDQDYVAMNSQAGSV